jgi:demethylmenaquinone methyltransferase/2-methoxy-6-polyprenyl-1,4-benzoquinol methylase
MKGLRRAYYDVFSRFYDKVIALHSKDAAGELRGFLSSQVENSTGGYLLDICTGTGSVASRLKEDQKVPVVGLDFSQGMLSKAKQKDPEVLWVLGSVTNLPFKDSCFGAVTCSHAFYELKGREPAWALSEVKRVLKSKGSFLMMEHDLPAHPLVKALYYIRLIALGSLNANRMRRREEEVFSRFFQEVKRLSSPTGKSTLLVTTKGD